MLDLADSDDPATFVDRFPLTDLACHGSGKLIDLRQQAGAEGSRAGAESDIAHGAWYGHSARTRGNFTVRVHTLFGAGCPYLSGAA